MQTRPNILFLQADQHRFDCVGINGHPRLRTPHLDGLAAGGLNFSSAFCPIPVCTPVRNCLMHGQWSSSHRRITNAYTEAPPPDLRDRPTLTGVLAAAGYRLGHVGKWHVDPTTTPADYGFDTWVPQGAYESWRQDQGLPPRPRTQGYFGELDPYATPEQTRLGWAASAVVRQLERFAGQDDPFFLQWDMNEPHVPNTIPEPYASMYPAASIAPWPSFGDTLAGKPYIQAQQLRSWQIENWSWEDWAPLVSRYLGEISLLDAQVGRVLAALDELGLADSTVVVYTTDHGDMCGSHRMIDKHYVMYDDVVRVPLVVRWPGVVAAGSVCDEFVVHALDLAVTLCELCGGGVPETFEGCSMLPLLTGSGGNGRAEVFSAFHGAQFGLYTQRMIRDRRWKYVWNATAEDELYDMREDPAELVNLAPSGGHGTVLADLRQRLLAHLEGVRDPVLNQWTRRQLQDGTCR